MTRAFLAALFLVIGMVLSACAETGYWCSDNGADPRFGARGQDEHPCSDGEMVVAGYERESGHIRGPQECWWSK